MKRVTKITKSPNITVKSKIVIVLKENSCLKTLTAVSNIAMSTITNFVEFKDITSTKLASFKFCPIVSCDVKRVFYIYYKFILVDDRKSFPSEYLEMYLVIVLK